MYQPMKAVASVVVNSAVMDSAPVELTDMKELDGVNGGTDVTITISITIKPR